ncbi:MAG: acid phosphatase [Legionella sp. 40-6]|nr:HAD family acid phosphatase [Legionella sp.]OJY35939.1 MAG: acid phosphatase [Legionella sp. 40-6]
MNKITKIISILILMGLPHLVAAEPPNLSLIKNEAKVYHDSGAYAQELALAIKRAEHFITQKIEQNAQLQQPKKLAIVLDIDETSLSNYRNMVARDFTGTYQDFHREILAADAPAIRPTLNLYQYALKHGIRIFFVTGRRASELEATKKNLRLAGYKQWTGIYLKPDDYHHSSIIPFKSQARAQITKQGYTIIASIGDQESDLAGGYTQQGFKLPNPYYYLP